MPFGLNWTPLPPQILRRSHGFLLRVVGVELELVGEVMGAVLGPNLLRPLIGMNHACISVEFSVFLIAKMHDSQSFSLISR